jgi:hypothetical protein
MGVQLSDFSREFVVDHMVLDTQGPEPKKAQLVEYPPLVGDPIGHHPVESADAIGAYDQKAIA